MQFSEKFKFPKTAYKELASIIDNITNEPDDDNLFNLPEWFKKKHGIHITKDIEDVANKLHLDEIHHWYGTESGILELEFCDFCGHGIDGVNAIFEILATVMKRHRVHNPVVIRASVDCDPNITKTDYGGVVYLVHPGLIRRMTTDDLAKQMLERFA